MSEEAYHPEINGVCEHGGLRRSCLPCELNEELQSLRNQLSKAKADIAKVLSILEKADLCKVSDKLHWAGVISEARTTLDSILEKTK